MMKYNVLFTSRYAIESYTQPLVDNLRMHCNVACSVDAFWESNEIYDIIHFQWPEELFGWKLFSQEDLIKLENRIKHWLSAGSKLVLTRHNELPHRKYELDKDLYVLFEKYCHGQIHMGLFSLNTLSFKNAKNVFIEHPNNIHLNLNFDKFETRKKLNIPNDKIVYLLFGNLRDKNDEDVIVKNFSKVKNANELIYVSHSNYVKRNYNRTFLNKLAFEIKHKILRGKGIYLNNALYTNEEINELMAVADVVIISRMHNLNSGILYLSYSFKKLVIAPTIGNITEKIFRNASFLPNNNQSVVEAFKKTRTLLNTNCNEENYKYVEGECNPVKIGVAYFEFYMSLVSLMK